MELARKMIELIDEYEAHTIEIRHRIHRCPELAFEEKQTCRLVRQELEEIGFPYEASPVEPGTVATLDSGKPGKLLMLRADMDALPIQEQTGLPFASEVPGVMHACGHDAHTANLLATARVLAAMKDHWSGKVKLVFQPGEERGGGGREMIRKGLMEELPDACFGMHVLTKPEGRIEIGYKSVTAHSDGCVITIHGKATHSSKPETGVDAIQIAAAVVTALYQIPAKNISPFRRSTLNVGTISGGRVGNIVPDQAQLVVMMRNDSQESRDRMLQSIERIVSGIAEAMGGRAEIHFTEGYCSVYNDEALTDFVVKTIQDNRELLYEGFGGVPEDYLRTGDLFSMEVEDFGFYSQKVPSCFIRVTTGALAPAHNERFQVNDDYIKLMTRVMCLAAVHYLNAEG